MDLTVTFMRTSVAACFIGSLQNNRFKKTSLTIQFRRLQLIQYNAPNVSTQSSSSAFSAFVVCALRYCADGWFRCYKPSSSKCLMGRVRICLFSLKALLLSRWLPWIMLVFADFTVTAHRIHTDFIKPYTMLCSSFFDAHDEKPCADDCCSTICLTGGNVTYSLRRDPPSTSWFDVDPVSGDIRVSSQVDREILDSARFQVCCFVDLFAVAVSCKHNNISWIRFYFCHCIPRL